MSKIGLKMEDYVNYIKMQLGGSIVSIEIEDDIPIIVNQAFDELKHYITDVETMTIPYSNKIDLTNKKVSSVVYIMRGRNTNGPGGFQDVMYIYSRQSASNSYTLTDYARSLLAMQNKSALATDLDFHYDKRSEQLYVYAQQALPTTITLVYIPEYECVEELIEPYWQDKLKKLSLAMTKQILGRVRGKYNLSSATYTLDADKLLAEAEAELTNIREYLKSNSDMLLPID